MRILVRGLIALIRFYQRTLSLDHGPFRFLRPYGQCKFHPTCSMYALQAFERFGVVKGGLLAGKRILHCHPWAEGGVDEIKNR